MLRRIEALGYRCLRQVEVELDEFQILVGPNAAGKSTLLDAVAFLGEFVTMGLQDAVRKRTSNFQDLVWNRPDHDLGCEIAVEVDLSDERKQKLADGSVYDRLRYEVAVREDPKAGLSIDREQWFPVRASILPDRHADRFPHPTTPPATILTARDRASANTEPGDLPLTGDRGIARRLSGAGIRNDAWRGRSVLGFLLANAELDPDTPWPDLVDWNVNSFSMNNGVLRHPSPPHGSFLDLNSDGSNLPWMVQLLKTRYPDDYREWLAHVRCVIPELAEVKTVERPEDRHAYLVLDYGAGLNAPSWTISDGTLRLLALTLLAYLPNRPGRCLVEEPENGIHPMALDAVYDSLRSMDDSQVFVATHSPTLVQRADAREILCFAKDADGATDIVRGDRHPRLRDWLDSADTSLVFATGVFG